MSTTKADQLPHSIMGLIMSISAFIYFPAVISQLFGLVIGIPVGMTVALFALRPVQPEKPFPFQRGW